MRPAARRLISIPAAATALGLVSAVAAGRTSGESLGPAAAVVVLARLLACVLFRLDRLGWRDLAFRDALTAALACVGGSAIAAAASATAPGPWPARLLAADFALYPCLAFGCAALAALLTRRAPPRAPNAVRTLIWGAGVEGRAILERIRRGYPGVEVFGWLDDDPALAGLDRDGAPVLGPLESLPLLVELHGVQAVLAAIPALPEARRALAEELARWSGAKLCFLPDGCGELNGLATGREGALLGASGSIRSRAR